MIKTEFLDLFLLLLLNFVLLFIIAVLRMGLKDAEKQPEMKNNFLITYTWDASDNSDIDGWIRRDLDSDSLCMFKRREVDVFILHNDNTGKMYGMSRNRKLATAFENISIVSKDRGYYEFSLHGYRVSQSVDETLVNVKIEQISPYKLIHHDEYTVQDGKERKIIAFDVDKDGKAIYTNTNEFELNSLIESPPNILSPPGR